MWGNLLPISTGMLPESILLPTSNVSSDDKLLRESGSIPERLFLASWSICMLCMLPSPGGIEPWSWLSERSRFCRRWRCPRLPGMFPLSPLKLRLSICRYVRFPRAGESTPVSAMRCKLSATARFGVWRLHVTPSQLQKSELLFQEASEPPSLTCALKASSVASSPALTMVIIIWMVTKDHSKIMTPIAMPVLIPGSHSRGFSFNRISPYKLISKQEPNCWVSYLQGSIWKSILHEIMQIQ